MTLESLGWDARWQFQFDEIAGEPQVPARILAQHRGRYTAAAEGDPFDAIVSGKFRHEHDGAAAFPAVGDWVVLDPPERDGPRIIQAVLPRHSSFSRKAAGDRTDEQLVAANVDTVFIVVGLDGDFNLRRIERYATLAWESGATPVVLLNKSDLCDDVAGRVSDAADAAPGVDVHALSAERGDGLDDLAAYAQPGKTLAFLGSSGVGKSSLVNRLLGDERQATQSVREDDSRGRHTTTHRELFALPSGVCVIDTPGMRELQLWASPESVSAAFPDVESLAEQCRFTDCSHADEPGCAVQEALESGELDGGRYASYRKQQKELAHLERKQSANPAFEERQHAKSLHKMYRKHIQSKNPKRKF